jgi:DNA topoisomerase VI subunit B
MKVQSGTIEAVPSKRLFLSIIADYDLDKAICELVDNALDLWIKNGKTKPLNVNIDLDSAQQSIDVSDDAGGIPKKELPNIIGPGRTGNAPTEQIIGIFGVGSKRAVVALAQDIKIKSRFDSAQTHLVEFD